MAKLKKQIQDKVEDVIYKKAKEEIEHTARSYFQSLMDAVMSFFNIEESQERKIDRISKEIQGEKDVMLNDNVVGIVELYTLNYIKSLTTLLGVNIEEESKDLKPDQEDQKIEKTKKKKKGEVENKDE